MTPTLRKRHRLIWIILAIALPFLYTLAIVNIPQTVYDDSFPLPESHSTLDTINHHES